MKKALLILDLDETLIHASAKKLERDEKANVFDYFIYERPNLKEFLVSVSQNFELAIWSSAGDEYVDEVIKETVIGDFDYSFVWGRSRAVYRRNYELDENRISDVYRDHYQYVKPLTKVKRLGYRLERILIVDDTPHKSRLNYGNAIYPSPYEGKLEDDELIHLANYLNMIKEIENFRKIEKRNWRSKVREK